MEDTNVTQKIEHGNETLADISIRSKLLTTVTLKSPHYTFGDGSLLVGMGKRGENWFVSVQRSTMSANIGDNMIGKGVEDKTYPRTILEFPTEEHARTVAYAMIYGAEGAKFITENATTEEATK